MRISDWSSDVCSSDLPPNSKSSLSWPVVNQVVARICGWAIPMMDRSNVVEYEADSLILCSCYVLHTSTLQMLVKQSASELSLQYREISRISSHAAELKGKNFVNYGTSATVTGSRKLDKPEEQKEGTK